jgi:hypothetical protein
MSKPARVVSKEIKMAAVALVAITLMATFPIIPMITLALIDMAIDVPTFGAGIPITVPIDLAIMAFFWGLDLSDAMHHDVTAAVMGVVGDWSLL